MLINLFNILKVRRMESDNFFSWISAAILLMNITDKLKV